MYFINVLNDILWERTKIACVCMLSYMLFIFTGKKSGLNCNIFYFNLANKITVQISSFQKDVIKKVSKLNVNGIKQKQKYQFSLI